MSITNLAQVRGSRIAMTAVPAAALTFGLFVGMMWMIEVDDFTPPAKDMCVVEALEMPKEEEFKVRTPIRTHRIEAAIAPPPPPALRIGKSDIDLEPVVLKGAVPEDVNFGKLGSMFPPPAAISHRDAQPIRPPVVSYPRIAMEKGIEGSCDVRFDVTAKGSPYNIQLACTNRVFEQAAKRAISKVEFLPQIVRGQAIERKNVVYPLVFELES